MDSAVRITSKSGDFSKSAVAAFTVSSTSENITNAPMYRLSPALQMGRSLLMPAMSMV